MNFSHALEYVKQGLKLSRKGWKERGMFIVYQKGYPDGIPINRNTAEALGLPEKTIVKFLPYLLMKTAHNSCVPWVALQDDLLANDWQIVEEE